MQSPKSLSIRCPTQVVEQRSLVQWLGENAVGLSTINISIPQAAGEERLLSHSILMGAYCDGQIVGVVLARTWDCGVTQLVPPQVVANHSPAVNDPLMAAIHAHDAIGRCRLCVSHVAPGDEAVTNWLREHGYHQSDDILILATTLNPAATPPPSGVRLDRCQDAHLGDLAHVITETYYGTHDFPELNNHWTAEDALQVYRPATLDAARDWYLVRAGETTVGCLLMTESPDATECELAYMGVLPQRRRQGWGRRILNAALDVAQSRGAPQITLGVDSGNEPAIRLYARAGFEPIDRRQCFWRPGEEALGRDD